MARERIQRSVVISAAGHAGALAFALVTFAITPHASAPPDSLPVEVISSTELSQIMQGSKNAKQSPTPKPLVEKVADPTPALDDPTPKISDKPEIKTASAGDPPPLSEEKPEPKPEKAEAKPEKAEPKKEEPQKIDPIAEALKKEKEAEKKAAEKKAAEKKAAEKKAEVKPPPKKPEKPQPKFDPQQMAALLDKHDPQRHALTGAQVNTTASLGLQNARAATLSQNELDALRARLRECWDMPPGALEDPDLHVVVHLELRQDGSLAAEPAVLNRGKGLFQITAESALRAIRRCQPFTMLPRAKFEVWRDLEINFDPREMMRG